MKKLERIEWITIGIGLATIIATLFTNEIRQRIMEILSKWQIITLIFGASLLIWVAIRIYVRNKVEQLQNDFNKHGEDNSTIANSLIASQEDLFLMKTLMQIKYHKPDSRKIDISTGKTLDGLESDISKLYKHLIKEEVWGNKPHTEILKKLSSLFGTEIIMSDK